eukprot:gene35127-43308_t
MPTLYTSAALHYVPLQNAHSSTSMSFGPLHSQNPQNGHLSAPVHATFPLQNAHSSTLNTHMDAPLSTSGIDGMDFQPPADFAVKSSLHENCQGEAISIAYDILHEDSTDLGRARVELRGNFGFQEWNKAHSRKSYDPDVLQDAIRFVTGPKITQKVAHGTHVVEKKDGTPVILPKNICHHTPAIAHNMYKEHRQNLPQLSHAQFSLLLAIACPGHTACVAALDDYCLDCDSIHVLFVNLEIAVKTMKHPAHAPHIDSQEVQDKPPKGAVETKEVLGHVSVLRQSWFALAWDAFYSPKNE